MDKTFVEIQIKISESDKELCQQLLPLIKGPNSEDRYLAKQLFKTSNLYMNNKPTSLYVTPVVPLRMFSYYKYNLKYLFSNNTSLNNYNWNYKTICLIIECIAIDSELKLIFYRSIC